jgi:hypothetical protein
MDHVGVDPFEAIPLLHEGRIVNDEFDALPAQSHWPDRNR